MHKPGGLPQEHSRQRGLQYRFPDNERTGNRRRLLRVAGGQRRRRHRRHGHCHVAGADHRHRPGAGRWRQWAASQGAAGRGQRCGSGSLYGPPHRCDSPGRAADQGDSCPDQADVARPDHCPGRRRRRSLCLHFSPPECRTGGRRHRHRPRAASIRVWHLSWARRSQPGLRGFRSFRDQPRRDSVCFFRRPRSMRLQQTDAAIGTWAKRHLTERIELRNPRDPWPGAQSARCTDADESPV